MNNKNNMDSTHCVKEDFIRFGNSFLTLVAERMFPSTLQCPNTFENIPSVFETADAMSNNSVSCNSPEAEQQEDFQTCNDNSNSETEKCKGTALGTWQNYSAIARGSVAHLMQVFR